MKSGTAMAWWLAASAILLAQSPSSVPPPERGTDCRKCHQQQFRDHAHSIHGKLLAAGNAAAPNCDSCHSTAHEPPRPHTPEFRKAIPETCGMCHAEIAEEFKASVHGAAIEAGKLDAPTCSDCHGEHDILPASDRASTINPLRIRDTCGRCHGDLRLSRRFGLPTDRLTSFDASFHGLSAKAGEQSVANCSSCHGFHGILPSSNPKSMTHAGNLAATCGKCHPGAGTRFALGPIHVTQGENEARAVEYVRLAYLILIPLSVGFMFIHNFGDWLRKALGPRNLAPPSYAVRMHGWERIQHALLASSFLVLVYTGFALKYPEAWWATHWSGRGLLHRGAGAVLLATALVHVASVLFSARLRARWKELLPRRRDFGEFVQGTLYRIGLRSAEPPRSAHSYVEKIEYWAVVWGTALMGVTGLLLWFNNWSLQWLPKWVLDLATALHFYEAVLATLAIAVWHFYSVIFDPDVYPMDTAWLNGKTTRKSNANLSEENS
jgi:cytochrome b subunit of formate dehydrogenase